eukprot:TRINITY_DN2568_c0_g1_i1.p1 TRINITY_DN2568_c0_g1~~TRINITY_DN2568_c0_g1_i1.p1  ORF type:complete len:498 (+),score=131.48 TRINITY_DN2568_c0_g1_i1:95-1588(+)
MSMNPGFDGDFQSHSLVTAKSLDRLPVGPNAIIRIEVTGWKDSFDMKKKRKFVAFVILVTTVSGLQWEIERRYSEFYSLNKTLRKEYAQLKLFDFPPKTMFRSLAQKTLEKRQQGFEEFLNALLELVPRPGQLNSFLDVKRHLFQGRMKAAAELGVDGLSVDDFELLKVLGKGAFGKVFLARLIPTGQVYAMKVLKKSEVVRRKQVEHTKAERRIMGKMESPFIVQLKFAFQTTDKLFMITEYCRGGELFFHLKKQKTFPEPAVKFYASELVAALKHVHSRNVVYRDLKPENVLLDEDGHVKLTDFGLSKEMAPKGEPVKTFCGTPEYLAPEMLLHRRSRAGYGKSIDWWSLGTLVYEMFTGWPPFFHENIRKMCENILTARLAFPDRIPISPEAKDFIAGLLARDPSKRLGTNGIQQVMDHPFFKDIEWDALNRLEMTPPFKPKVMSDTDISNFDEIFTNEPAALSSTTPSEMHFEEFSFVDSGTLVSSDDEPEEK